MLLLVCLACYCILFARHSSGVRFLLLNRHYLSVRLETVWDYIRWICFYSNFSVVCCFSFWFVYEIDYRYPNESTNNKISMSACHSFSVSVSTSTHTKICFIMFCLVRGTCSFSLKTKRAHGLSSSCWRKYSLHPIKRYAIELFSHSLLLLLLFLSWLNEFEQNLIESILNFMRGLWMRSSGWQMETLINSTISKFLLNTTTSCFSVNRLLICYKYLKYVLMKLDETKKKIP